MTRWLEEVAAGWLSYLRMVGGWSLGLVAGGGWLARA